MVCDRLTPDVRQSRPADVLVADWERGRPAAWDVTVTSPLTPALLNEVGMTASAAAAFTEQHNHTPMIQLGWVCVPLAVKTYGKWGSKAHTIITRLATQLAICASVPKRRVIDDLYGRLRLVLSRCMAKAILARILPQPFE